MPLQIVQEKTALLSNVREKMKRNSSNHSTFYIAETQKNCPCVPCQKIIEKKVDPKVSFLEFSLIGRYALRIQI